MEQDGPAARTATAAGEPGSPVWKPVLQVVLVPVAILAVMWLVNVLLVDPPYFRGTADRLSKDNWTFVSLGVLVAVLAVDLGLLRGPRVAPWAREDRGAQRLYLIGCKGCGTVFEKAESSLSASRAFKCPNCGRPGRLAAREQGALDVVDVQCRSCGRAFRRYRATAECPHCHARST